MENLNKPHTPTQQELEEFFAEVPSAQSQEIPNEIVASDEIWADMHVIPGYTSPLQEAQ